MSNLLPPGVHPHDPSTDVHSAFTDTGTMIPPDMGGARYTTVPKAWSTNNARALGTFQRLSDTYVTQTYVVDQNQGGTAKLVSRRPGRTRLTLWVPSSYFPGGVLTTTPFGVMFAEDEGVIQQSGIGGAPLFVGDSVDISSEAGVWVGLQPGATVGVVCMIHCWESSTEQVW